MPLPDAIAELVERFSAERGEYHKGHYNETQTRIDYVNPLFTALGWDMDNHAGLSELLREVVHEDAIKIGGTTKAPDYSFRAGGTRKFFVETKKPAVRLFLTESPAFQLRRYGWTVKMPLSILTNFEEFAVYDTRVAPDKKDAAKIARLEYFKYTDYEGKWDSLVARFSRDAVFSGAFDRYAEEAREKRISVPVDKAFLAEISGWREKLAGNIVKNNPGLGSRELNYAVQMIIDRLIFLRISEDRGAEPDHLLQPLMNRGGPVYPRLLDIFRHADARYNSGLFHFEAEKGREGPDDVTPHLTIDDRPLREIIASVYYPESPFEFSVFPADILGQVYEQFLGKVIRVSGGTADVEDKPEVKKAGGVYYTPTYIVDYIVRQTVGKLVDGCTPTQVSKLTILDPACGSGSFLIGAYQFLLDWHLRYYLDYAKEKSAKGKNPTIYLFKKTDDGSEVWRLTTAEKKRILLNNIYGVDIDTQAVEVTKLSLLLKVLEGESAELIDNSLKLFKERALPDLEANIKCGNSLIGPDFYADKDMALFDLDAQIKINTFDWKRGFPEVMKAGGFNAVIGNPPWGADIDKQLAYFHQNFPNSTSDHTDSFKLFVEKAGQLAKEFGFASMIVPSTILRQKRLRDVRDIMLQQSILSLVDLGEDVFKGVVAPACIFVFQKSTPNNEHQLNFLDISRLTNAEKALATHEDNLIPVNLGQQAFSHNPDHEFKVALKEHQESVAALAKSKEVECKDAGINYQRVNVGMIEKGKSDLSTRLLYEGEQQNPIDKMYWKGSDIDRYTIKTATDRFCRTNYSAFIKPGEVVHLNQAVFDKTPKILLRQTSDHIIATLDNKGLWFGRSVIAVVSKSDSSYRMEYFLGLFNSRYFDWMYRQLVAETGRVFAQVKLSKLNQLPIRTIDFAKPGEKAKHDKMVMLVERMLTLHKDKAAARLATERNVMQQQIEATDTQIDRLVYDLYGLTDEEIAVVEGTR